MFGGNFCSGARDTAGLKSNSASGGGPEEGKSDTGGLISGSLGGSCCDTSDGWKYGTGGLISGSCCDTSGVNG